MRTGGEDRTSFEFALTGLQDWSERAMATVENDSSSLGRDRVMTILERSIDDAARVQWSDA